MGFDFSSFEKDMGAVVNALPSLSSLVKAFQIAAPNASGLATAGMVLDVAQALEPTLAGVAAALTPVVNGLVAAHSSTSQMPLATNAAPVAAATK